MVDIGYDYKFNIDTMSNNLTIDSFFRIMGCKVDLKHVVCFKVIDNCMIEVYLDIYGDKVEVYLHIENKELKLTKVVAENKELQDEFYSDILSVGYHF